MVIYFPPEIEELYKYKDNPESIKEGIHAVKKIVSED
jgi:hypothetical protein